LPLRFSTPHPYCAALFLFVVGRAAATEVALVVSFEQDCPPDVTKSLRAEVQRVMNSADLRIRWVPCEQSSGQVFQRLVVVRFRGRCEIPHVGRSNSSSRILGSAEVSDGAILPYVTVYCSRVVRALPIETDRQAFTARLRALGRALGRVVAHELYHIFGQTRKHGRWGLAQRTLTGSELTEPGAWFEKPDLESIRRGLVPRSGDPEGVGAEAAVRELRQPLQGFRRAAGASFASEP